MSKTNKVLVLRTCNNDLYSRNDFQYPQSGLVTSPDWDPEPKCENGLHGLLWGEGDGSLLDWNDDAKWIVIQVKVKNIVDLNGKVKFKQGKVVHCGDRKSATDYILEHGGECRTVVGAIVSAGKNGQATAGDHGTAIAGNNGKATAGNNGTATAGNNGTATAGDHGIATAGDYGKATAGDNGTATAGHYGKATAGNIGLATVGTYGQATAGNYGKATAGDDGKATAGYSGQASAGYKGIIQLSYWDEKEERNRIKAGYIGEEGLKPNVNYKLDDKHNFVEVV